MDILAEIGNLTPKEFHVKLVNLLKTEGDIMEDDRMRRTYVLTRGSARISLSTYLVNNTSVLTILYGKNHRDHCIEFIDCPDDGDFVMRWHS